MVLRRLGEETDELQAKGKMVEINGFLPGFYKKLEKFQEKTMQIRSLHPRSKKFDFLELRSENLYFYYDPQVSLITSSGQTFKLGKLWFK